MDRIITHTCGHEVRYFRSSSESLDVVAKYATNTKCWPCWRADRDKEEKEDTRSSN